MVSDIENQPWQSLCIGVDAMTILLGNHVVTINAEGWRSSYHSGGTGNLNCACGLFETESANDKNRAYIHLSTSKAFLGKDFLVQFSTINVQA